MTLHVVRQRQGSSEVFELRGPLDVGTVEDLLDSLLPLFSGEDLEVEVGLQGVTRVDLPGALGLVSLAQGTGYASSRGQWWELAQEAADRGRRLRLVSPPPELESLLEPIGLFEQLPIDPQ